MAKYAVTKGCCYCGECMFCCPVGAVSMDKGGAHIDTEKCIGCGQCYDNCASEAIERIE